MNELVREHLSLQKELEAKKETESLFKKAAVAMLMTSKTTSDLSSDEVPEPRTSVEYRTKKIISLLEHRSVPVQQEEIASLARKLSIKLQAFRIPFDSAIRHFEEKAGKSGTVSLFQVVEILSKRPFEIRNPEHIALMALYLVEDNTAPNRSSGLNEQFVEIQVLRSIFRHILGSYQVMEESQCRQIKERLREVGYIYQIFEVNKSKAIEAFHFHLSRTGGTCTAQGLQQTLSSYEIILSPEEFDYTVVTLYLRTRSIEALRPFDIFEHLGIPVLNH